MYSPELEARHKKHGDKKKHKGHSKGKGKGKHSKGKHSKGKGQKRDELEARELSDFVTRYVLPPTSAT